MRFHDIAEINPKPSSETVCKAIASKEKDAWMRFGHFIPMYREGEIWVLKEGTEEDGKALRKLLADKELSEFRWLPGMNVYGCDAGGFIFYAAGIQMEPIYKAIAQTIRGMPYGKKFMELSIDWKGGEQTSFAACEESGDLCDAYARLVSPSDGLCTGVYLLLRRRPPSQELKHACERLSNDAKACVVYIRKGLAKREQDCKQKLTRLLAHHL